MDIVIFILVLVVLILVHEFGHFLVAKWSGMKVEEFGIGYPPRAWGVRRGETEYTLNWLPFGGFVKIYGEDESEAPETAKDSARAFSSRPRILQALVLVAGIVMNMLLAWVILTGTLMAGMPRALSLEEAARSKDATLIIASVLPDSPAERAGIVAGDTISEARYGDRVFSGYEPEAFTNFISSGEGASLSLSILRDDGTETIMAEPEAGIVPSEPQRRALGVAVATVGTLPLPFWEAPIEGALLTWRLTEQTAIGLWHFFGGLFTLTADLSQISGPVGIVGAVGTASADGLISLLTLTAVISINLALINLLPVPALDGGRLLFVAIEAVLNRPLPKGVAAAANTVGFALLILLMLVVTASDVWKLIG
jgi:regulator of sigma E protease